LGHTEYVNGCSLRFAFSMNRFFCHFRWSYQRTERLPVWRAFNVCF